MEEINALHHRSSEKIARNLEQLLSGPRVGEESQLAHLPSVGVGAVADADQSHGKSVEGDGGRMQMQGDHHGTNAAQGEQGLGQEQGQGLEGKHAEHNALPLPVSVPVPALSTAFSFARITQVHPSISQSVR